MFVTFEGLDGSGKSTQAELLRARLEADGGGRLDARAGRDGARREDPRSRPARRARDPVGGSAPVRGSPRPARREVIRPALERGASVICDRYVDSSVAYQGVGRGLGLERVLDLNLAAVGGLLPDRTFLLALDVAEIGAGSREHDRLERESDAFHARAAAGYRELAAALPGADRRPRRDATRRRPRRGGVWSTSRPYLSSPRRSASRARAREGRRTRTSCTARRGWASGPRRSRSLRRCWGTSAESRRARIRTCTCSSRSAR